MRFYKYPYLSIFIVGYYLLEHQGYYYRIREMFGYPEAGIVNYVIPLNRSAFDKFTRAPDRKLIMLLHSGQTEAIEEVKKAAKKAKERQCSPVMFGEVDCSQDSEFCNFLGFRGKTDLVFVEKAKVKETLQAEITKKQVLKLLKRNTEINDVV